MIVRLLSGSFEEKQQLASDGASIEKKAMLVYCGKFDSLDGAVEITDEDIDKLVENHNSFLSKLSSLATGGVPAKFSPPIQLDHSTSAKDTVGRLVGNLEVGEHTLEDGTKVKCLMGTVKILGKENVEKVQDGRWTHLSIGADLQNHKISELTITPFPAAAEASLLSKSVQMKSKVYERVNNYEVWISDDKEMEKLGHKQYQFGIKALKSSKWVDLSGFKFETLDEALEAGRQAAKALPPAIKMSEKTYNKIDKIIMENGRWHDSFIDSSLTADKFEKKIQSFLSALESITPEDSEDKKLHKEAVQILNRSLKLVEKTKAKGNEYYNEMMGANEVTKLGKVFDGKVLGVAYSIYKDGGKFYWQIKGHGQSGKMHDKERAASIEAEEVIRDLKDKGELSELSRLAAKTIEKWETTEGGEGAFLLNPLSGGKFEVLFVCSKPNMSQEIGRGRSAEEALDRAKSQMDMIRRRFKLSKLGKVSLAEFDVINKENDIAYTVVADNMAEAVSNVNAMIKKDGSLREQSREIRSPDGERKNISNLSQGEDEMSKLAYKDEYDSQDIFINYKDHEIGLVIDEKGQMHWNVFDAGAKRGGGTCSSEADGKAKAKKHIDEKLLSKLSKGDDEMPKYAEMKEKMAMYEKCKKHLMEVEKMSEEEADMKLGEMDDESVSKMSAERDEHEKKMSADADADDAAKKQMSAKLQGTADGLKRLVGQFKATSAKMDLAQKKSNIVTRLSRLKAEAKITPAELKKMNVDEMAKKDEKLIDEALKTYEGREAVLHLGVYGSVRAMSTGQLHGNLKKMQMERQELESRLNMPSKREAALKRLAEIQEEEKGVSVHIDNVPQGEHTTDMSGYDLAYDEMKKLMDEGKHDEAKEKMKKYMSSLMKTDMASDVPVGDVGKEMSALAEEVKKMQTGLVDFVKLTAPVLGLKAEELVG